MRRAAINPIAIRIQYQLLRSYTRGPLMLVYVYMGTQATYISRVGVARVASCQKFPNRTNILIQFNFYL